jgi:hypothetical protein
MLSESDYPSQEIYGNPQDRAKIKILETLDVSPKESLKDFPKRLSMAIKGLPQYQRFEAAMQEVPNESLPYEIFKAIRKSNDKPITRTDIPRDGVLISSMKQGYVACAGRSLMASNYLQEKNYPHTVVEAPAHSFLLLEQGVDTLAYCDAENNLFFTFPRSALEGYQGSEATSECQIKEFTPRPEDITDGTNFAYSHFITLPAKEGLVRQYLGNVKAALAGLPEFESTPIKKDREAADSIDEISEELLGPEDPKFSNFLEQDKKMVETRNSEIQKLIKITKQLLTDSTNKEDFSQKFITLIQNSKSELFLYLKNAHPRLIKGYAEGVWGRKETILGHE